MSSSEGKATRQAGFKCSTDSIGAYLFAVVDDAASTAQETVIKRATASAAPIVGVTYEATAEANRTVGVNLEGVCHLKVDGATANIAAGDRLKSDANGKGVPVSLDHDEYGAVALCASTADGDIIPVLIQKGIHGE